MLQQFFIKCNCTGPRYLYWNGVTWVSEVVRAMNFASKREARTELKTLSPPRPMDRKDRGPEVWSLDYASIDGDD